VLTAPRYRSSALDAPGAAGPSGLPVP